MQDIFKRGIPTAPDVQSIRKAYPDNDLRPGMLIPYADIERIINSSRGDHRFSTVTNQWRRDVERDTGLVIESERNVGFRILTESGKLFFSRNKMRTGLRAVKRSFIVSTRIDRAALDPEEQAKLDKLTRLQSGVAEAAQIRTNLILPSLTE